MTDADRLRLVDQWLKFSADHMTTAQVGDVAASIRCYHAQQAAETAMKAALVFDGRDFPKTHDLEVIAALIAPKFPEAGMAAQLDWLTEWAMSRRYPGPRSHPTAADTERAVRLAQSIVEAARAYIERVSE